MASMDIDDLISSFKSSTSISQESVDLAALQAQLTASLMRAGPANCPTTPTISSIQLAPEPFSQVSFARRDRGGTPGPSGSEWERQRQSKLEDDQDMEVVENSLGIQNEQYPYQQRYHAGGWSNKSAPHSSTSSPSYSPPTSDLSSFNAYAAADPFFAAQLKNTQAQPFGQGIAPSYGFAATR
jgi:hypothetical protein